MVGHEKYLPTYLPTYYTTRHQLRVEVCTSRNVIRDVGIIREYE